MTIPAIRSDEGLTTALSRIDELWGAEDDSPEGFELDALVTLVEQYEDEHYPIEALASSVGDEGTNT